MARPFVRYALISVLMALAAGMSLWPAPHARAAGPALEWHAFTSEFPAGFRVEARASSDNDIDTVAVRLKIGQQTTDAYDYLEHDQGKLVEGEFFWRTDTRGRYVPPGTIITYNFEIHDTAGLRIETEPESFVYYDARFVDEDGQSLWQEVSRGTVTVSYKGPVKKRADDVLNTIVETLENMVPVMGEEAMGDPIRVTMYNNSKEMLEALPPRSATVGRELITEGQAFNEFGTLLVLGGGRLALGTASHEVMHIITHRVGDSILRRVPAWLSEGLSEFANVDPGYSYDIALDFAVETDRLLPHVYMPALPGDPEDVIIFYGQSRSIVRMMIRRFGPEAMRELMATHKSGANMDRAMRAVYGFGLEGLDAMWRESIGAEPQEVETRERVRPTAVAQRVPLLYSLTPQADSDVIGDRAAEPTSTPTEVPSPTPVPEPTSTPTPEPTATPVVVEIAVAAPSALELPAAPAVDEEPEPKATGGGCSAPVAGSPAPLDLAGVGLLLGLVGLGFRSRRRG